MIISYYFTFSKLSIGRYPMPPDDIDYSPKFQIGHEILFCLHFLHTKYASNNENHAQGPLGQFYTTMLMIMFVHT